MTVRFFIAILMLSSLIAGSYKTTRYFYDSFQKKMVSEQICRASEARLQVGATREVVDFARAVLVSSGYPKAEIRLKAADTNFSQPKLSAENSLTFNCELEGIQGVELSINFPKLSFLTSDLFLVLIASFIILWLLKIIFLAFIKGLQTDFANEFNKMVSKALGMNEVANERTPRWINWMHELNPHAFGDFSVKLSILEYKIKRQARDLRRQIAEKAKKESQLVDAKKFKDFVHQVRHDLRQTVGVVRSSLKIIPPTVTGREVLEGAISSLDTMINDLKDRELKHHEEGFHLIPDLVEVVIAEAVREQQVALANKKIEINFLMNNDSLHFIAVPREELKRVIINLIVNSAEAIHGSGNITLISAVENNVCILKIIDNGCGFSEEAINNLFKKGFTTKENGSGLGLSYSQRKIREWGGKILVDSKLGRTEIEISLPVTKSTFWAHPAIISNFRNLVVVDDHPVDLSNFVGPSVNLITQKSLKDFEKTYSAGAISAADTIIFDLHLEEGRRAIEVLPLINSHKNYMFMTSDYLNSDLIAEAEKRKFSIIPKELVHFALNRSNYTTKASDFGAEAKSV